jgi:uncharacterized RDD family membrane protein YckC
MKCKSCGHDYPGTLTRCTRCGTSNPNRIHTPSQSRLIEFPRQACANNSKSQTTMPAWRAELSEKVRAVKARRSSVNVDCAKARAESMSGADFDDNPVVKAALSRVQRASENSNRTAPMTRSVYPSTQSMLVKEAKAMALEPEPELSESVARRPMAARAQSASTAPKLSSKSSSEPAKAGRKLNLKAAVQDDSAALEPQPAVSSQISSVADFDLAEPIDEIEPRDYLAAEIRRVDEVLGSWPNEVASISSQIVSFLIDVLTIAISSIPFLALIELSNGNFASRSTKVAATVIIMLISLFYLGLTHCLCAKTFGMMFTGLCVVDARTFQAPTSQRALLRAIGCFAALAPAGIGLLWAIVDRNRRGLQDYISQTLVVREL